MRFALYILAFLLAAPIAGAAAPAAAPRIDLEAGLDITEGLVRSGAYVPVRLTITNRMDLTFDQVRLESSSPVRVVAPFHLAPAATGETTVPAFYAGGDLVLQVECLAGGRVAASARLESLKVTPLPDDAALVGVEAGVPKPEPGDLGALQAALGRAPRFLALDPDEVGLLARCGLLDAALIDRAPPPPGDVVVLARRPSGGTEVRPSPFPRGVRTMVDAGAYQAFAAEAWPAEDRQRLWLGLGVFALAVLGVGLLVPRRRTIIALAAMAALGAAATAAVWRFGGVRGSRATTARVFYAAGGADRAAVEWYAHLAWRGSGAVRFALPAQGHAWPVPVVRGSNELVRPLGTLVLAGEPRFEADRSGVLLHGLGEAALPPHPSRQAPGVAALAEVALESATAEVLAPARKAAVPLGACAVEWKEGADPDLAYAGRSLAWWAAARQEGAGRFRLTWVRDAPAAGGGPVATMLPALIVTPGAP